MLSKKKIKEYIIEEFSLEGDIGDISYDLDMIATGIIDSMAILKIVAFIENECDVFVDPDELEFDNFNTIEKIHTFIGQKSESYSEAVP